MKIIERQDGFFHWETENGENVTTSVPFEKDSETYLEKIEEGYELVLIPQAEKDAHEQAQLIEQVTSTVQAMLDTEAQSRGYDNINAISKYIGFDNAFRVECEALAAWCAGCWSKCYELQSGGVMPSDLLAEMPELGL